MIRKIVKQQARAVKRKQAKANFFILAANEFLAGLRLFASVAVLFFASIAGSFSLAMSVFAVRNIAQGLMEVPTGVFSDKIGRKRTIIIGCLAELMGATFYALSFSNSYGMLSLYMGAIAYGFADSLFSGNNNAMIYETLSFYRKPHEVPHLLGRISSMGQLALGISGLLAGFCLWLGLSYNDLVLLTLFPATLNVLLSLLLVEPPQSSKTKTTESHPYRHMKKAFLTILSHPRLRWLALAASIKNGFGLAAYSFTPGFIDSVWPSWATPLYRAAQNGLGAISFWFAGSVIKRFGLLKSIIIGSMSSNVIALLAYALSSALSPFMLMATQLSYAIRQTSDAALQQENFSDTERSTMGSIIAFMGTIMGSIASLLIGILADQLSAAWALIILCLCSFPTTFIYIFLYKKQRASK